MTMRVVVVGVCMLLSCEASAQTVSPALTAAAIKQASVVVTDDTGQEFAGNLLRVDEKIFTVKTNDGDIPFSFQRVSTIYKRGDSLRNGLIIGLITGTALGALSSLGESSCFDATSNLYKSCATSRATIVATSIAVWTGLSVGIDALRQGWTRIYPPRQPTSVTPARP